MGKLQMIVLGILWNSSKVYANYNCLQGELESDISKLVLQQVRMQPKFSHFTYRENQRASVSTNLLALGLIYSFVHTHIRMCIRQVCYTCKTVSIINRDYGQNLNSGCLNQYLGTQIDVTCFQRIQAPPTSYWSLWGMLFYVTQYVANRLCTAYY